MFSGGVAHDLVVAGNHVGHFHMFWRARKGGVRAAELLDDVKIGIGAPLSDLVPNNRDGKARQCPVVVGAEPAGGAAASGNVVAGGVGKRRRRRRWRLSGCSRPRESRAGRGAHAVAVEAAWSRVVPLLVPAGEMLLIAAGGFVACVEHDERGV